jgi:hypothetical protein
MRTGYLDEQGEGFLAMMTAIESYEKAEMLLRTSPKSDFVGARDPRIIASAEKLLDAKFPPSYCRFLLEFGCGNIGGQEIYGVIDENLERRPIPNAVWLNIQRHRRGWSQDFFVFYEYGDGTSCAFNFSNADSDGESAIWLLDVNGKIVGKVEDNFGEFLLSLLK